MITNHFKVEIIPLKFLCILLVCASSHDIDIATLILILCILCAVSYILECHVKTTKFNRSRSRKFFGQVATSLLRTCIYTCTYSNKLAKYVNI